MKDKFRLKTQIWESLVERRGGHGEHRKKTGEGNVQANGGGSHWCQVLQEDRLKHTVFIGQVKFLKRTG